jgi:dTDP-4-amino-4,6-dideoxygalactose transaminase
MKILMNAFTKEPESLIHAQMNAVERVLRSGWWVLGGELKAFEKEWSNWSGIEHTVGVGNGMDALEIGIRALGIGPGDEIITTPMTAFATVLSILRAGAVPVLADIDPDTAILSLESTVRCISPKTRAVMLVHLYGQSAPLKEFESFCQGKGIHLIEDCAQAHGAYAQGRPVGSVGLFSGWSFYPTKNLGAIGDAGALSTMDPGIAEKARQLRNYGQSERYHHPNVGLNSRLDELQAAILRERLKSLDQWTKRRREIAHAYSSGITNQYVRILPLPKDAKDHVHHLFVITTPQREALTAYLKERNIETLIHYPVPVHHQGPCKTARVDPKGLGHAEKHAQECLSLPCNPFLSDEEAGMVIEAVNGFKT